MSTPTKVPDGVYIGMDESTYHALERCGSGDMTNLLHSPGTFWARSWMNPDREHRESDAATLGTAYHTAILEPDTFRARYVKALDPDDFPGALMTQAEIREALASLGEARGKAGEKVLDQARRLRDAGYDGDIWHLLQEVWEGERGDREALKPETYDRIIAAAEGIRRDPEIGYLLQGGLPEVTICWTQDGVPCKARVDYLSTGPDLRKVELKTFEPSWQRTQTVGEQIPRNYLYLGHYRQDVHYQNGIAAMRSGAFDLPPELEAWAGDEPHESWIIYRSRMSFDRVAVRVARLQPYRGVGWQSLGVDELAEYVMGPSRLAVRAQNELAAARRAYKTAMELFGPDEPWTTPIRRMAILDELYTDRELEGWL